MQHYTAGQRLGAEFLASAFLLTTVTQALWASTSRVGTSPLLCSATPLRRALSLSFDHYAGTHLRCAHFNPAVSVVFLFEKEMEPAETAAYIVVQVLGAIVGVLAAHVMFGETLVQVSAKIPAGPAQWF
jgi:glycerol uptake facilitator-like aquaporin